MNQLQDFFRHLRNKTNRRDSFPGIIFFRKPIPFVCAQDSVGIKDYAFRVGALSRCCIFFKASHGNLLVFLRRYIL